MHPALVAYQGQLLLNTVFLDVYIQQTSPGDFNTSTGIRSNATPTRITGVPAVHEPTGRMFKSGPGGQAQQVYELITTFPLVYLGANKVKLNDYVALSFPTTPLYKERYSIKSINLTGNMLISLGLLAHPGEVAGLSYDVGIEETLTFVASATRT